MKTFIGLIGIAGLICLALSFKSRKDVGEDRRSRPKWKLRFIGIGLIVLGMMLANLMN